MTQRPRAVNEGHRSQLADELLIQAMVGLEGVYSLIRRSNEIRNGHPYDPTTERRAADRISRDCWDDSAA